MSKALITGGAGFLGLHLGRRLAARGYSVHLLDNFARGVRDAEVEAFVARPDVELVHRDLGDPEALSGLGDDFTHVFHLAAIIGVAHVLRQPYRVLSANLAMLTAVIDFAREQPGLERFVFASTSEVYAGTLKHFDLPIPTPETTPLAVLDLDHPRTSYMLSKIYGEALCHHAEIPCTIVRPHNFYGPRMGLSHVIPELLRKAYEARDGDVLEVYSVDHRRTFCYVDDAVEVMIRAAESPACRGETINIGNQEPEVRIDEVAAMVVDVVGKELTIEPRPATPGSPPRRCPDTRKALELTGYNPQVDLRDGIRRTFDWYRENVFLGRGPSAT